MRYVKQFAIIIMISFAGELLKEFLPFLVPASIYGLLIMLLLLMTGIIKVEHVKDVSTFLLDVMPVMFIPAAVGLMESWDVMQDILVPAMILCIVGTLLVMVVSGRVTQRLINMRVAKGKDKNSQGDRVWKG